GAAGLVEFEDVDRFKPVINLTESGWTLVRGQTEGPILLALSDELAAKIRFGGLLRIAPKSSASRAKTDNGLLGLAEPAPEPNSPPSAAAPLPDGDPLVARLRELRRAWAREANLSPGYVFNNETLDAIAHERPRTPHDLAQIKGIGPSKLERYG